MEILGYVGALCIGLIMGLLGGGGSILAVPILVYLMGVSPVLATAYSLFIVGLASLIGAGTYYRQQLVSVKTAVIFGIPSLIAVYLARKFLVPAIPDPFFHIGSFSVGKDMFIMGLFAFLMVGAAISMIRKGSGNELPDAEGPQQFNFPLIMLEGAVVGVLTGIVGAGGGFLIIPALVVFSKLPMKLAVGTSLLIISAKSLIGFLGDLGGESMIAWNFLFVFSGLAIVGIFLGVYFSKFVPGEKLKPAFGYFVLLMGVFILTKELVLT
ncbi:MAG: sulfite exporter TauE/SafE family protein [Bacteroidota bacterium]